MTITEFADHVGMTYFLLYFFNYLFFLFEIVFNIKYLVPSKLLSDTEVVSIFLHFTATFPPPILFPIAQRRRFVGKQMYVNRFQRVEASWGYSGTPDRIKYVMGNLTNIE